MDYNEAKKPLNFFKSNYTLKLEKEKLMREDYFCYPMYISIIALYIRYKQSLWDFSWR